MVSSEEKRCPRCYTTFTCHVCDVTKCQCFGISLTDIEKASIANFYKDCLCRQCLLELKRTYTRKPV